MKYSRFEGMALAIGTAAIAGTILASFNGRPMIEEIAAQLLLLVVLIAAVHYGRNGGFLAAVAAIVVYIAMRSPLLVRGLTPNLLVLIVVRTGAYGVVGIIGGEVCGRIKYLLARLEGGMNLDEETGVYNESFVARLLDESIGIHSRYKVPFSIALFGLSPALTSELRPSRRRSLLRAVANHIRNDVRLVDDVGRLTDGTFVLVMPQTPRAGGEIAAKRVRVGIRELLGARDESVTVRLLSAPEDSTELDRLRGTMTESAEDAA